MKLSKLNEEKKDFKPQNAKETIKRLLKYFAKHKLTMVLVTIGIIISSLTSVANSIFIKVLVDDYITPLVQNNSTDFSGLFSALSLMGLIFLIGTISTWFYTRIMVSVTEGILKQIRDEMFEKMQKLPVKYFDTHTHGEIMSHYTNDTDTLTEMISESVPQIISSLITIVAVFIAMVFTNIYLTLMVIVMLFIMLNVVKVVATKSKKYFVEQQSSMAKLNGYIEEMVNGQKVVKVFCHEDKSKAEFDQINERWCNNSTNANSMANILMPIMGNMANIQYVIIAIVGGLLIVKNIGTITLRKSY